MSRPALAAAVLVGAAALPLMLTAPAHAGPERRTVTEQFRFSDFSANVVQFDAHAQGDQPSWSVLSFGRAASHDGPSTPVVRLHESGYDLARDEAWSVQGVATGQDATFALAGLTGGSVDAVLPAERCVAQPSVVDELGDHVFVPPVCTPVSRHVRAEVEALDQARPDANDAFHAGFRTFGFSDTVTVTSVVRRASATLVVDGQARSGELTGLIGRTSTVNLFRVAPAG